jgi:hypothetical protein
MVLLPPTWLKQVVGYDKNKKTNTNVTTGNASAIPDFLQKQQNINSSVMRTDLQPLFAQVNNTNKGAQLKTTVPSASVAKPAPTPTPAPTPKITVTLPNGTKTTGFINPKDNKTYFDSGFTKPVATAGAKVTKITGDKREDFTVGGTAAPKGGAAVGGNVAGTGATGATASGTEAGAAGAGGTQAGTGGTATPKETSAIAYIPDAQGKFKEVQSYVRNGITYYKDENGVEQRVPVNAVVDVNGKFFERGENAGRQLSQTEKDTFIRNFSAGQQAEKEINAQVAQTTDFMNRLEANRNQAIVGAERQAEMARQGMQNQMFQDWLGVRQAMTNRGLTGSGIAEDANTRLALGQQQQLANLFTGLSTQINEINQNADLTKQEKEQQILDLQNSYFDLQRQIAGGMNEQQIKAQQAQTQADTEFAKIYGYNPTTGEQTIEAKKFAEQVSKNLRDYNLDLAGYTGYVTFKNEKGEVVSVPTLLREKFVEEKLQFGVKLKQEEEQEKARLTTQASKAQADAYEGKVNRVRDSLKSNEDLAYKRWKAAKDNWESIPEKNRDTTDGQRALSEMNSAWSAWQNSANSVIEYNNNPLKFVEEANI